MRTTSPSGARARVYQQLRTAHLERAHHHTPATIIYTERSYDFEPALAEGLVLIRGGDVGAARAVLASRFEVIEVNEPLVRMRLLRTLLVVTAGRLVGVVRRMPVQIVAHAIENRDPFATHPESVKSRIRLRLDDRMSRALTRRLARLSFGTPAAEALYRATRGTELRDVVTKLIPELPCPCDCALPDAPPSHDVVFVGAFDERKGVRQLLEAWPEVLRRTPTAFLRVLGKGPLTDEVLELAGQIGHVDVVLDPPRDVIHDALRRSQVLVLLSQPRPRWREQIGLPIVEGLAHGCTVVTTDQTGLAAWLVQHDHVVVDSGAGAATAADSIVEALDLQRTRADVLDALPSVDGRAQADGWLLHDREDPR